MCIRDRLNSSDEKEKAGIKGQLLACAGVLGLFTQDADEWFQEELGSFDDDFDAAAIDTLVAARQQAKLDKDYARADEIRSELLSKGIVLEDAREGTQGRRA